MIMLVRCEGASVRFSVCSPFIVRTAAVFVEYLSHRSLHVPSSLYFCLSKKRVCSRNFITASVDEERRGV